MGTMIKAKCKCGFETQDEIHYGAGFFGPGEEPAACLRCNKFFVFQKEKGERWCQYCAHLVKWYFKGGKNPLKGPEVEYPPDWEFYCNDEGDPQPYYCPECRKMDLRFYYAGQWD